MADRKLINMKSLFFRNSKTLIANVTSRLFSPPRKVNADNSPRPKLQTLKDVSGDNSALLFHVEETVLRPSTSTFPYFMLVAFEVGSLLRFLVLFLSYPLIKLAGDELGLKIMVFVAFFGVRARGFRAGTAVMPKFLLEDSTSEGVEVIAQFEKKIGFSDLPRVMVESFVIDYLAANAVLGRELKEVGGYFIGLMEEKKEGDEMALIDRVFGREKGDYRLVGLRGLRRPLDHPKFLSRCKAVYSVSETEKRNWRALPGKKYPKPLIFHDGRLGFKPDFLSTLAMLTWLPFGIFLSFLRLVIALSLPHKLSVPILSVTGMSGTSHQRQAITSNSGSSESIKGKLYVCNHRTLLDPIYLSMALQKPLTAVTYSLSRFSELLAPIRTVRLSRDREKDSQMMERLLRQGDLVVCPEGTTCREPYLLRFSPLFAELTDVIVPVAVGHRTGMLYGTTAGGRKFMDPFFLLLNPTTHCDVKVLGELTPALTCRSGRRSKFDVANYVQSKIAEELGFECTNLTRRDKYVILAGNEGRV